MSSDIELYKYNWDRLILDIRELGITDTAVVEKILLAFGERCGNRYYLMDNEYYDEYNSFSNLIYFLEKYFKLDTEVSSKIGDIFISNGTMLPMYKSAEMVQEELGMEFES